MATITVKNIPNDLYQRLKASAEANRRSVNSEIIACIERTVTSRQVDPDAILARARNLRRLTAQHPISDDLFNQAKVTGRP